MIPKRKKFTHPDFPAVLLQTSTVAKTKNYWFSGWSPVELKMLHLIPNHLKASLGGPASTTGLNRV